MSGNLVQTKSPKIFVRQANSMQRCNTGTAEHRTFENVLR